MNKSQTKTENMVKYFSVDWLARSHRDTPPEENRGTPMECAASCRPHVPCVVQPSPPAFGKSYLQPKFKSSQSTETSPSHSTRCTSPTSESNDYSSGYDSEAASSECLSVDEASEAEKEGSQRRVRTKFTPEQISRLLKIFDKHKYLEAGERGKTARKLGLTETQVRTWFQNRRMKLKREVQDLTPQIQPLVFQHLHPIQYHAMAGQQSHYPSTVYTVPVQPHLGPHCHRGSQLMIHNPYFY
ncbi:homeobox protein pv.1-like [Syngnathoides biaculeatus]|uniref:homeobox protein pv.1-like n=1 Tax=Syngnathoides biaculeatus TaxID=300417 RepID=UPI002ADE54B9|nr:homeobox protein pv.1-like [Syngnathoides biaculeatus]XP_061693079.1 homeobox protein pv.1-like [Syngnathoides biaculeatus]XP_061693080.1 homeobox protein pv.1-like [Syngnathoides biaculeatus]XP_061693081.1 homeobox protein pv.1-like [Syngnathoides biaculeatus]